MTYRPRCPDARTPASPSTGIGHSIGQDDCFAGRWRSMEVRLDDGTTRWIIRNAFDSFDTDDLTNDEAMRFWAMASEELEGYRCRDLSGRQDIFGSPIRP